MNERCRVVGIGALLGSHQRTSLRWQGSTSISLIDKDCLGILKLEIVLNRGSFIVWRFGGLSLF